MSDPRCLELAEYFVADDNTGLALEADELAEAIQRAVDDWFRDREPEQKGGDVV